MKKEDIFALHLNELNLSEHTTTKIFQEWCARVDLEVSDRARIIEAGKSALTVLRIIADFGDLPAFNPRKSYWWRLQLVPASQSFKNFANRLLELGLTSLDWPLLAIKIADVYRAHLDRAKGDRDALLECPTLALGMSSDLAEACARLVYDDEQGVRWEAFTIEKLLNVSPADLREYGGLRATQSLCVTRQKLRSLGFTNEDGPFLSEGNRKVVVARVAKDLRLKPSHAREVLEYFNWHGVTVLD